MPPEEKDDPVLKARHDSNKGPGMAAKRGKAGRSAGDATAGRRSVGDSKPPKGGKKK
jgi:hypothetical protein